MTRMVIGRASIEVSGPPEFELWAVREFRELIMPKPVVIPYYRNRASCLRCQRTFLKINTHWLHSSCGDGPERR